MWVLIITLLVFGFALYIITYLNRRNKKEEVEISVNNDGECCGAHEVCDRDTLLAGDNKIEYFDDEELDSLACIAPENYSEKQLKQLSDVFYTLKEYDVAAWLRSLQLRRIELPIALRDEALLIVSERRQGV
jgi:hypothetical protein